MRLQAAAQRASMALQGELDIEAQLLRSGAAFLLATRSLAGQNWNRYAAQLIDQGLPSSVKLVGYAQRITAAEIGPLEQAMRADGEAHFEVHPKRPAQTRAPILYGSAAAAGAFAKAGFDLLSVPQIAAASARATDTGQPALTAPLNIAKSGPAALAPSLLLAPVFRDGRSPKTIAQRRATVSGFIFAVFQLQSQ